MHDRLPPFPRRLVIALVALASGLFAQPATATKPSGGLAEEFAALEARCKAARSGPDTAKQFVPLYQEFVQRHAPSEEALAAKLWLLQQTWWERTAGTMEQSSKKLCEEILAEYPKSKQLDKIAEYHYVFGKDDKAAILERLVAKSPHAEVQAAALWSLASTGMRGGDAAAKDLARERLQVLATKHKDLRSKYTTYGELAASLLHPHDAKDLAVGKPAPEITGTDIDGKVLKLSDHRGKVVVLDFWGFW